MTNETVWVLMSRVYEGLYEDKFWRTEEEGMVWIDLYGESHLYLVELKRA